MNIILIGGFSEIFELCEECGFNILGYVDGESAADRSQRYSYDLLGSDSGFPFDAFKTAASFFFSPDSSSIREKIYQRVQVYDLTYARLISTQSRVSRTALIGHGSCLQYGTNVSASCVIGDFVKVNTYANVMHDSVVGNFSTIAPNAAIMGRVTIGERCYIGANATIIPEITVCPNAIIGAGAVVNKDILEPGTYVGVPARRIK